MPTFRGEDAQLDAAIKHLQELIKKEPRHLVPEAPPGPNKTGLPWAKEHANPKSSATPRKK